MASSDTYDDGNHSFLSRNKSSINSNGNRGYDNGDIFPELSISSSTDGEMKLSHSAAKHKMAIRPKKKGPSRPPRRPIEVRLTKKLFYDELQKKILNPFLEFTHIRFAIYA